MYNLNIEIIPPISSQLDSELKKKIFYLCEGILSFETKVENDNIVEVEIVFDKIVNTEAVKEKVENLLNNDIRKRQFIPEEKIREFNYAPSFTENAFEKMLEMGIAFEQDCGQVAFSGLFIDVMNFIDSKIREISIKKFNATEYQYPTLIPTEVVKKCGYIKNFPHLMMFVTYLHNDINNYLEFKKEYDSDDRLPDMLLEKYCHNKDYCLPPTMCHYTYNQFKDKQFKDGENMVVTSRGKSFRYESKYAAKVERLWDFTIRETVFMGDYDFVKKCRQDFMELTFDLIDELKLSGYCCNASDAFFIDEQMVKNISFQKALKSKYELQLNISDTKTIAVGSFNFHDSFFGKNFNMHFDGQKYIKTGCTGFGLERFAYAFVCQHGLDRSKWPVKV